MRSSLALILFVAACGDNLAANTQQPQPDAKQQQTIDAKPIDAPPMAVAVALTGGANDLWWDAASNTLFYTDDNANTFNKWTDEGGTAVLGALPPYAASGPNPGGLWRNADGSFYSVNFGNGAAGGNFEVITAAYTSASYTGLDLLQKYLDVEVSPDGNTVYVAGFSGTSMNPIGEVYKINTTDIDTTAHTVIATPFIGFAADATQALKKEVGMVVTADSIYLSNQTDHVIEKWDIATKTKTGNFATGLDKGDFLLELPDGTFLTGGAAKINHIAADGTVTVIDTAGASLTTIHGLAYDNVKHRLFAIDHQSSNAPDTLHIIPYTP
ncbi:MAG: hypothetical protein QM831_08550 [Kofleriaceae bacterium]